MIDQQRKQQLDVSYMEGYRVLSWMKEQGLFTGQVKATATEYAAKTEEEKQWIKQHLSGQDIETVGVVTDLGIESECLRMIEALNSTQRQVHSIKVVIRKTISQGGSLEDLKKWAEEIWTGRIESNLSDCRNRILEIEGRLTKKV